MFTMANNPMDEKTVLITGSTDGIGQQTALELARLGYWVIVHGRSVPRGRWPGLPGQCLAPGWSGSRRIFLR